MKSYFKRFDHILNTIADQIPGMITILAPQNLKVYKQVLTTILKGVGKASKMHICIYMCVCMHIIHVYVCIKFLQ